MTVTLSSEIEAYLLEKVRIGLFANVDQAADSLLSQIRDQETLDEQQLAAMREMIAEGIADIDAGRVASFTAESVAAEMRQARTSRQG